MKALSSESHGISMDFLISHASGQVRELTKDIRAEHQGQCKSRIEAQHAVVDSIASFIHKQPGFRSPVAFMAASEVSGAAGQGRGAAECLQAVH